MTIAQWSTTASNNASGVTNVNWSEGQAPSTVNDSARNMMADVATWLGQASGAIPELLSGVAGTANAITATGPAQMASYVSGQRFHFTPGSTNTGATTINITPSGASALGAKSIFAGNSALVGGELHANIPVLIVYDGTQFQLLGPIHKQPTRQVLTSGSSATYTTPTGATRIVVRMVGGGGGGGAAATNNGSNGTDTTFGTLTAAKGSGGGASASAGGAGGSGTNGDINITGAAGQGGGATSVATAPAGGQGGSSVFGGAGAGGSGAGGGLGPGGNAATNSGSGGGGGGGTTGPVNSGGGGGAGGYVEKLIAGPAATYTYTVGAGGSGGSAGTNAGGNGAAGIIIVDEFFN